MPWTTFSVTPSGGSQAEDAQLMTNDNNGNTILTLPSNVIITDVLTIPAGNSIGISTGQTSAGAAEFIRLVIKYEPVQ